MAADLSFGDFISILTLAVAVPAWAQVVLHLKNWKKLWLPTVLVTMSLLTAALFETLVNSSALTLDYSLRFAAFGIPLSVAAIIVTLRQRVGDTGFGIPISSALSVVVWLFLTTLH